MLEKADRRHFSKCALIFSLLLMLFISGCTVTQGRQKDRIVFLNSMNMYATLIRDFAGQVIYFRDLDLFRERMKNIESRIKNINTVKGWETSETVKNDLLVLIEQNNSDIKDLSKRSGISDTLYIKEDIIISSIKTQSEIFIDKVFKETVSTSRDTLSN
jgi:hypothetical protein